MCLGTGSKCIYKTSAARIREPVAWISGSDIRIGTSSSCRGICLLIINMIILGDRANFQDHNARYWNLRIYQNLIFEINHNN